MRTTISILLALFFLVSCIDHGEKYSSENFNLYVKGDLPEKEAKLILNTLKENAYFKNATKEISWQIIVDKERIRLHIIAPKKIKEMEVNEQLKFDMIDLKNELTSLLKDKYRFEIFFTDRRFKPVVGI